MHTVITNAQKLTNYMEQSPSWEANSSSAGQEIPHILRNTEVRYRLHKFPSPVHILSQYNPVHAPRYVTYRRSISMFSSRVRLRLRRGPFPLMSPHQNPVCTSSGTHTCPHAPPVSFFLITRIIFGANLMHKMQGTTAIVQSSRRAFTVIYGLT
jgi:hypothetical protein